MRVKISYGVDMSEIPQEILNLLDYVYTKKTALDKQLDVVDDFAENESVDSLPNIIDKARRTLADMDSRLADIEAIATGYSNYLNQGEENVQSGRPTMDSIGGSSVDPEAKQPRVVSDNE